jgi:hypothetical protein
MLSLGLSIPFRGQGTALNHNFASTITDAYQAYVEAASGYVESIGCVLFDIFVLGIRNYRDYVDITTTEYEQYVTTNSGTVESYQCLLNQVLYLSILGTPNTPSGTSYFTNRWVLDGATIESESCLTNAISALNQ